MHFFVQSPLHNLHNCIRLFIPPPEKGPARPMHSNFADSLVRQAQRHLASTSALSITLSVPGTTARLVASTNADGGPNFYALHGAGADEDLSGLTFRQVALAIDNHLRATRRMLEKVARFETSLDEVRS